MKAEDIVRALDGVGQKWTRQIKAEEDYLEEIAPVLGEVEGFRVRDLGSANWSMRKLQAIRSRQAELEDFARAEIERISVWLAEELDRHEKQADRFEGLLIDYHRHLLAEDDKRKTVRLPGGSLKARKSPDQWEIDTERFLPWAEKERPDLIRIKKEVDRAATKRVLIAPEGADYAVTADGEFVPGVHVEVGAVQFSVVVE